LTNEEMQALFEQALRSMRQEYATLEAPPSQIPSEPCAIMLPMSDEVRLFTVYRLPAGAGPFPTVIIRSSYPLQEDFYKLHAEEYSKRGFAFVYQFCRGTGKSEGKWVPNVHDRQDGKDTLEWLAAQQWVENIGYMGSSYLAFTGWVMADILPPKVKTLYLTHYGTDRFASAYQNGLFRQDVLTAWAMENAGFPITADYYESLKYRPHIRVDEDLWGQKLDWYRDWVTNTSRQDAYWQSGFWKQLKDIPGKVSLPVYIGEGWYDHHLGSALRTYEDLLAESKAHSVMRIGAWNHMFLPCVEGTECKNLQNTDTLSAFRWFDTILRRKQIPRGMLCTYQIGSDGWEEQPVYPFKSKTKKTFYLSAQPDQRNAFMLSEIVPSKEEELSYQYDPTNPVMSHGAESVLHSITEIGSLLQPECGWREDVVSFISQPLQNDVNILGKINVRLYVSSTAEDTAFTTKLMEVYPDGRAFNIRSGITTLGYRMGSDLGRMEYRPGTIVEATVDLWDISWRLHQGSRLRIDISSSDFPQYAIHTNFAGIWALQERTQVAKQTLHFGALYPSQVIVPVN
jgi:uncharacterized protein